MAACQGGSGAGSTGDENGVQESAKRKQESSRHATTTLPCTCDAHKRARGAAKRGGRAAAATHGLVRGVQQQALLWVHGQGLAAHGAKELRVEQVHTGQEHAKLQG